VEALLEKRDAPLDFDGDTNRRSSFRQMKQGIKELEQHYKVKTSNSNLIVVLFARSSVRARSSKIM